MLRYVAAVLTVIAFALALLAINPWITSAGRISDPGDQRTAGALKEGTGPSESPVPQTLPKAWGRVAGVTIDRWLVFEAADGTVRLVALGGGVMREFRRN
jgi:hypothetical protein